jgi:coatomer subunit beta
VFKFPEVAPSIVPVPSEFLSDTNELAASDVLLFMREAVHKFSNLTEIIIQKLLEVFPSIRSSKVLRSTIWILGEFAVAKDDVETVIALVKSCLGEVGTNIHLQLTNQSIQYYYN